MSGPNKFAVFSDRCNSTFRHSEHETEEQAQAEADRLSLLHDYWHYAAPVDFDPYAGYGPQTPEEEAEWYAMLDADAADDAERERREREGT